MTAININEWVKVKLTDYGWEVLWERGHNIYVKTDAEGYSKFQLWDLMNIFGHTLYLGNPKAPFEAGEIIFYKVGV
jgi:hypothetical protein